MRRKFLHDSRLTVQRSFTEPEALAAELIAAARAYLGEDYDMDTHFTPSYRPWRQRIAMVPDGDLFVAIREGRAEVLTDGIERFTKAGLRLSSGLELAADIIVTATGLNLNMFGDIVLAVDGQRVDPAQCVTHRGIMFTGLPNFATVFGYLRSSWTLRADLVSRYLCRMLDHMDAQGANSVTPTLRGEDRNMERRPWIDPDNFNAGYIMRSLKALPRQGDRQPWVMTQDYYRDQDDLPSADLDDGTLVFRRANAWAGDTV
jgi:cation diffusion facilitator CzcD-associated flavoprotein CzcO